MFALGGMLGLFQLKSKVYICLEMSFVMIEVYEFDNEDCCLSPIYY